MAEANQMPADGPQEEQGTKFSEGGQYDLSGGPVKKRSCTNPEWCILFLAHIVFFWICALQGAKDGNPWKLVNPRDFKGQYCGIKTQWNAGTDMTSYEKGLYTLNVTSTVDPLAASFICSSAMKSALTTANVATTAEFDAACTTLGAGTLNAITGALTSGVASYMQDPTKLLTGGGGGTSILSQITKYFHPVCTTSCGLNSAAATEEVIYQPAPNAKYYSVWMKMVTACSVASPPAYCAATSTFKFKALPKTACPYADRLKCIVIPKIQFTELASGYCVIKLDDATAAAVTGQMKTYVNGLANTGVVKEVGKGFESAVGDIQTSWDVFIIVAVCSIIIGFVYLVLLRFLVKPVIWGSILLVFLFFCLGGGGAVVVSSMCKDADFTDSAKALASTVATNSTLASDKCAGQYQIAEEDHRDILKWCGIVLLAFSALYCLAICCLFGRIRLAININEVAAMFVYNTPHILFVPLVQVVIGILWCAIWMFLASFLLSQVPEDFTPKTSYATFAEAAGTADTPGKCTDVWPTGFAWMDTTSTDCVTNQKCWKCAPPRFIFDYRFAFSFFSFLWHNAFFVAVGQCTIAGAVGLWFFKARGDAKETAPNSHSRLSVCIGLKNAIFWHAGSLAFGSFILAVVQFLKYLMYYLSKQAKAQKNKILEIVAKCAACLLWCLEKCVKFLNKNAYIQTALMGTGFCVSAKNAFFLILRNAVRFAVMGGLGGIIRFIGKGFIMAATGVAGFFILQGMHPEIDTPVVLVVLYVFIGWMTGGLFMNVFGLAVDSTLQCFIATEEMGIQKDFVPEKLQRYINDTSEKGKEKSCGGCCCCN